MSVNTVTQADLEWFANEVVYDPFENETPEMMRSRIMKVTRSKARPAEFITRPSANAFGDYGHYDSDGNPLMEGAQVYSDMDDLTEDWKPYATQTEQRMLDRGDEPEYEQYAWFSRKGDPVVTSFDNKTPYREEKEFTSLPGYHLVGIGSIQCFYCATTFRAEWFAKQDGEVTLPLMRHFATEAIVHSVECKAKHSGLPLIRMVGYDGKPRHQRASLTWGKPVWK